MKFFKPFEPPVAPTFSDKEYNIKDFGAISDSDIKCTKAIAAAINECSKNGGGKVIIPKGKWLTGAIHFKDNVNLHLENGAEVFFSKDFEDYLPAVFGVLGGTRCYSVSHLLYAHKCKNIAITGSGTFDGNGDFWWPMLHNRGVIRDLLQKGKRGVPLEERVYDKPDFSLRPRMLQFVDCENVLVEGVSFFNSPSWTIHPVWCKNIIVRNVNIKNPTCGPNTDGINLDSCKRGLIDSCHIDTGDDIMCLKTLSNEDAWDVGIPCEDIEIRNCTAPGGHGAITIGSETSANIKNAYIHDCNFGRVYSAVRIKSMPGRGGYVENIDIENITADISITEAVIVTLRYNEDFSHKRNTVFNNMPEFRNISISNVKCNKANRGVFVLGEDNSRLENIYISDITADAFEPMKVEYVKNLNLSNINLGYCEKMSEKL